MGETECDIILRLQHGQLEFEAVEAESFALEQDPLDEQSRRRYYVLRDASGSEVARFNEKDVVGIRKGSHVAVGLRQTAWGW